MKKLFLQNKIWGFFIVMSLISGLYLLHEYKTNNEISSVTDNKNIIIEKEATIDEDEFESTDFYIFKNITELFHGIFSLSL
jgi:hypothetical protein